MRSRALVAAAAALLLLSGCAAQPSGEATPEPESPAIEPVIDRDFPDPDILEVDGTYYAYATNSATTNVQVATSTDLESWELSREDALPELPSWIIPGKTWAPEVAEVAPGSYVLYFTATNFRPTYQCIGVATATDPAGPFTVVGEEMLICPPELGGAIDAGTFLDEEGTLHLLWKNDGNCCGLDTWLYLAPLSADGLTLAGEPRRLLMQTEEWEGDLVEAPTLLERDGTFYLFYSANSYGGDEYAIGLATADSLDGEFTKVEGPWLSTEATDGAIRGPGGQDVVDGGDRMVVHGWDASYTQRGMHVLDLEWQDGMPRPVLP